MTAPDKFGPYSSVAPYFGSKPAYITGDDADRIQAYDVYEKMYWSEQGTFKVIQRGSDSKPIYVPTPRMLIETTNRFLCRGFNYSVDPAVGTPADQESLSAAFRSIFRRERFMTKFRSNKRFGLLRGDALYHIVADPSKPAGRRLSVYALKPQNAVKILDPNNKERIIGWHIIEAVSVGGKDRIKRQTYKRADNGTTILSSTTIWEVGEWDDRIAENVGKQPVQIVLAEAALPPAITSFPIYHIKNFTPEEPWGSSELRGFERMMAAINQSVTDEELYLALDGIGVYATTSGPPTNEAGDEVDWQLGPGRVVEHAPDTDFVRVAGTSTITPFQEHIKYLEQALQRTSGTPDIAVGTVDVQVAQSGIALQLQMGPMLAKNEEHADELLAVHDNLFWDIQHMWLPAYESINLPDCDVVPIVGDPLPEDRDARIKELIALATSVPPLISAEYAQQELAKYGYDFPDEMTAQIQKEAAFRAALYPDPFAARLGEEENNDGLAGA